MKLSDRVRPGSEAAPWVIEEIKRLEAALEAKAAPVGERDAFLDAAIDDNFGILRVMDAERAEHHNLEVGDYLDLAARTAWRYFQAGAAWQRAQSALAGAVNDGLPLVIAGAIFDFAGFLTTRERVIEVGATANASPVAELVQEWAELRGLSLADAAVLSWQYLLVAPAQPAAQGKSGAASPSAPATVQGDAVKAQLLEALNCLIGWAESVICQHNDTHRGGVIWEICDDCGLSWADDMGGKPEFSWPGEVEAARAAIAAAQEDGKV